MTKHGLYGELPDGSVIFAACDSGYFIEHGLSFVVSSSEAGFNTHIHVTNPTPEVFSYAGIINAVTKRRVTYTFDDADLSALTSEQKRAYYACLRFHVLPSILYSAGKVMVLDIDCMIMRNFQFPEVHPVGYFPRANETHPGMQVAAGAVYMTDAAMNVALAISDSINNLPLQWFVDQLALTQVFRQIPETHTAVFDNTFMDWEFTEGTTIWTGKGPRKYNNPTYIAKKLEFAEIGNKRLEGVKDVLLKPRLDLPFKKTGLEMPKKNGLLPIRKHWENFANTIAVGLTVEMPSWMFNSTIEGFLPETRILVPHKEKEQWGGGENTLFYMQTVFPWLFTIDPKGWSGGARFVETFRPNHAYTERFFDKLREYASKGGTKFVQPESTPFECDVPFIFVPLQLPHDETIKYHSDVSVEEFVTALCEWADSSADNPMIVFKGHPVNLESMIPLREIISNYKRVSYQTDLNIHDVIPKAESVYIINSGTGQESMLHDASVVCFADCEYKDAVINGDIKDLDDTWQKVQNDDRIARSHLYRKWYHWYERITFDSSNKNLYIDDII